MDRKVSVSQRIENGRVLSYAQIITGIFHQWADIIICDDEDSPIRTTVALVEDSEGKIIQATPEGVKFLDPKKL